MTSAAAVLLLTVVPILLRSQPRTVTRSFNTWGEYLGGADSSQYSALDQIKRIHDDGQREPAFKQCSGWGVLVKGVVGCLRSK